MRYNFSARNIITLSSGYLKPNEIELPYSTFLELYRLELINYYSKIKKCTVMEANVAWEKATNKFDDTFYNIMLYMISAKECRKYMKVMIGRNPNINYLSNLVMTIAFVKKDIRDKTMTIPSNICKPTNADFDGDVLNIFRIFSERFIKKFGRCFDPLYNEYISRVDGRINPEALPFKDEACVFYQFNNV